MNRIVSRVLVIAMGVVGAACADKGPITPRTAVNPKMQLVVSTKGIKQSATASQVAPRFLWVGVAAVLADGDTGILAMANAPITGTSITVTLDVDISKCLAANSAKGRSGCQAIVGASLRPDSISRADSVDNDPFSRAYDYTIIGPFELGTGRAPTIPAIDLSATRFSIIDWQPDASLMAGNPWEVFNNFGSAGTRALSGVIGAAGTPVLFSTTASLDYASFSPNTPNNLQPFPALAIFENGVWRRVLAKSAPALNPQLNGNTPQGFMDVAAFATNDVYIAATSGLYHYDGAAITKVNAVTDSLYSVGVVNGAGGKLIVAGGPSGITWVGNGTTFTRYNAPTTSRLDGVCINSATEAYASSQTGAVVFRFNGTAWSAAQPPATGAPQATDLQCTGTNAFLLGSSNTVFRWTGTGWTSLPTTGLIGRSIRISAVSPTEIYAAGDSASVNRAFLRFDGTRWNEIGRKRFNQNPVRVWADPRGGTAYAVSPFARLERMTATSTTVLSYQPALRDAILTSATSGFAVGWNLFLARFNGAAWTVDAPPAATSTIRILQSVWSDGPNNAWTVGNNSTILRYDGTGWNLVSDAAKPIATADNYNGVWGSGNDVWAVGDNTIVHCRSVTNCAVENTGGGVLYGIWGSSATNIFAVGAGGRILRYNGTSWTGMNTPTGRALARVAGSGPTDVWAVGDSVLIHYDGTQWTNFPLVGDLENFRTRVPSFLQALFQIGLWVKGPREAYLGGDNGLIARWDGTGWRQVTDGKPFLRRVLSITGTSTNCALAVTEGQTDSPTATLWRGVGNNGCMASPLQPTASWP